MPQAVLIRCKHVPIYRLKNSAHQYQQLGATTRHYYDGYASIAGSLLCVALMVCFAPLAQVPQRFVKTIELFHWSRKVSKNLIIQSLAAIPISYALIGSSVCCPNYQHI
jgi:hypothetical protein